MNSLTPFIRHEMDEMPGPWAPEAIHPPLGKLSRTAAGSIGLREDLLPHKPAQDADLPATTQRQPTTDGTALPCRQRNAECYLAGDTPGVMASYAPETGRPADADPRLALPAQEDEQTVRELVEWREEAPYG